MRWRIRRLEKSPILTGNLTGNRTKSLWPRFTFALKTALRRVNIEVNEYWKVRRKVDHSGTEVILLTTYW